MDPAQFNKELQKYKIVRAENYCKSQVAKKSVVKSQTKSSTIETKNGSSDSKLKLSINEADPDSFWKVLEVILSDKANLSQKEVKKFVGLMKKGKSEMMELVNLDDLNTALVA